MYFTDDVVPQEWFDTLGPLEKLDVITQKTVVGDSSEPFCGQENTVQENLPEKNMRPYEPQLKVSDFPEGLDLTHTDGGWEITAKKDCTLTLNIQNPQPGSILALSV